ncbi:MAG: hypothetical protein ACUVUQ_12075, partial [Thermodesulfovibrionales bacterium]
GFTLIFFGVIVNLIGTTKNRQLLYIFVMYSRFVKFLIILPIFLHLNIFDFIHPVHNFNSRDNCPICQFHTYQNNTDFNEADSYRPDLPLLLEKKNSIEPLIPTNLFLNTNQIHGPPNI